MTMIMQLAPASNFLLKSICPIAAQHFLTYFVFQSRKRTTKALNYPAG